MTFAWSIWLIGVERLIGQFIDNVRLETQYVNLLLSSPVKICLLVDSSKLFRYRWQLNDLGLSFFYVFVICVLLFKAGRNQSVCATHNNTEPDDWSVLAVAAAYLLFTHLLLVNLVIAMFRWEFFLLSGIRVQSKETFRLRIIIRIIKKS